MDPMTDYTPTSVTLNANRITGAFGLTSAQIASALGTTIIYNGVDPNGNLNSTSTANAPGHWFSNTGATIAYGDEAYIYSELSISDLVAHIGQYPDKCKLGDKFTIRQALVYTKSSSDIRQVTLVFNITIGTSATEQTISLSKGLNLISTNVCPSDSTISTMFNGLDVKEVKTMDAFWIKGRADIFNSLKTITAGKGYIVNMNIAGTLKVTGKQLKTDAFSFNIKSGWQLIGCPYQISAPLSTFFNANNCSSVKNFTGFWSPNGTNNSILNIEPGKGYYIKK